jgi:hypothetical protein
MTRLSRALAAPAACLMLFVSATALHAQSKNPADYPYRIHIFNQDETTFYHNRHADESKGDGRANLFAKGEVHAVDFSFDCGQKLKSSIGFETYPAKWRKPGQELVVLLPVFGHSNTFFTCTLKTDVKSFAYTRHNGAISQEPSADFKAWMDKHGYDPEHGKNTPAHAAGKPGASE